MALDLTAEQKDLGKANTNAAAAELSRRGFMKSTALAGTVLVPAAAATYYGFTATEGKPIKAALIGCGDEGGVLMSEVDPRYVEFIALCDIRPYNKKRIIEGEGKSSPRRGYREVYGKAAADRMQNGHIYDDFEEMLAKEKDIEAVVIAVPLHLHAKFTIKCLEAGKHVLCEKLMARTVTECKQMIKTAKEKKLILSVGHQRHYSLLYAHALEMINAGLLGDIKHIRALWHRNFSWNWTDDGKKRIVSDATQGIRQARPVYRDGWFQPILQEDYDALKDSQKLAGYGYTSLEQLVRWRLYNSTGGGLMAELGSHQLDACSIFLGKVKPLACSGVGTRSFFGDSNTETDRNPRSIDDHVYMTFEFPGKNHPKGPNKGSDKDDVVVMTYSSISTNQFEPYGECVMGTRGTMIVSKESELMLFKEQQPGKPADPKATNVAISAVGNKPALEAASTWGGPSPAATASVAGTDKPGEAPSRGYKEEMADFAHCIRLWDKQAGYGDKKPDGTYAQRLPRCHGEVAMADAILALSANLAMAQRRRIEFDLDWFSAESDKAPDQGIVHKD
jgi:predicted dehydrogenase